MIQKFFSPSVTQWHTNMRDVITWSEGQFRPSEDEVPKKKPVPEIIQHLPIAASSASCQKLIGDNTPVNRELVRFILIDFRPKCHVRISGNIYRTIINPRWHISVKIKLTNLTLATMVPPWQHQDPLVNACSGTGTCNLWVIVQVTGSRLSDTKKCEYFNLQMRPLVLIFHAFKSSA